ncbi:hypothetical protein Cme02nite_71230 [Catellatospora methionotrophica]|uniref:DUF1345 domain-containing protein n=1 Tax=Catellatospora methionotrophica TaxID=121620 RepID=A0A8J3PKT6_9ACTN|nr:DUF1345 domain-containing protein [Catellatospora methionotrophica]GIG18791.1 hypothetical protein Cme02nite_71230 [Catellatospora methionotrophica]
MADVPSPTFYHRWLGWHAPALRRAAVVACLGLLAGAGLAMITTWELAAIGGWNVMALTFLLATWPMIIKASSSTTRKLAVREDESRGSATLLLLAASVASLTGVFVALRLAGLTSGSSRGVFVAVAGSTVIMSWVVVNTVFTLRYAHLYFRTQGGAIQFGSDQSDQPDYRDFAYVAFTIGMTYQVSDTTLRDRRVRRTVLVHALVAYLFGVVIVAGAINLIAGLVR